MKIVVFASTFLDKDITNNSIEAYLTKFNSLNNYEIEYRCDRDSNKPLESSEFKDVVAVIADLETYDSAILKEIGREGNGTLELIARYGVGTDNVDIGSAKKYGIMVTNCPGCNSIPTAEWAVAMILDVAGRKFDHHLHASGNSSKSIPNRLDLTGKTLGIIGTGHIGKKVVELMQGFDFDCIAYSPNPDANFSESFSVNYVDSPEEVYSRSDIISLHAGTNDKEVLIGSHEIRLMKSSAVLVNCARFHLVDNLEVYNAVKEGRIFGYGLDDQWPNTLPSIEGLNIIVSSHVGSDTNYGKVMMKQLSLESVVDFLSGVRPKNVVINS